MDSRVGLSLEHTCEVLGPKKWLLRESILCSCFSCFLWSPKDLYGVQIQTWHSSDLFETGNYDLITRCSSQLRESILIALISFFAADCVIIKPKNPLHVNIAMQLSDMTILLIQPKSPPL